MYNETYVKKMKKERAGVKKEGLVARKEKGKKLIGKAKIKKKSLAIRTYENFLIRKMDTIPQGHK